MAKSPIQRFEEFPISVAEIKNTLPIVRQFVKHTQLIRHGSLAKLLEADVYVKHENHNPTGSFKIRGGVNLLSRLKDEGIKGVVTHSTGNHGLSIATSAKWFGLHGVIVVPEGSNRTKTKAILETGCELVEVGETLEESGEAVSKISEDRGYYVVHPANEPHLINGVGTGFLEIIEDEKNIDYIFVPLGAGSEAAAVSTVFGELSPQTKIIAVQAEESPAAFYSWAGKSICERPNRTFAGGFATGSAYDIPFGIYSKKLSDFILLTEDELYDGMAMSLCHTKNLTEGAGASTISAAYKIRNRLKGKKVVLQMSGCNASSEEIAQALGRYKQIEKRDG